MKGDVDPMTHRTIALALPALLALAGCSDHTEGVTAATVSAGPAPVAPPSTRERETLALDRSRSTVGFTGAKVTGSHDGAFSDFDGAIELDPEDLTASAVRVTIRMASVAIEPEDLAGHLRSADFFDVERFPEATFTSSAIRAGGEGRVGGERATHTVTGALSLHGQTRTITFPAIVSVSPTEVRARSETSIDRRQFGIVYPGMPDDLIRDQVVIRFDVRAPR